MNSRPTVAVPSTVSGLSKGWISVLDSSRSICLQRSKAAWTSGTRMTVAPRSRQLAMRAGLALCGITTVALVPTNRAV